MRTTRYPPYRVPDAGKVRPLMLTVIAPADGRVVDTIAAETPDRVRAAVERLRDHAVLWHSLGVVGRVHWLTVFRNWLLDNRTDLVALLGRETGKTATEADAEFGLAVDTLDHYRAHGAEFLGGRHPPGRHTSRSGHTAGRVPARGRGGQALGGLANNEQSCNSVERVIVESSVHDTFLDRLTAEAAAFGPVLATRSRPGDDLGLARRPGR
ncbi:aldehyde dehydrogenase family protein [Nocardia sp. NPDC005746]|uniref:aldehyde dehydrogenase family protein n=1 Tax=Nocardia sp. NPDC005746 TaxID=3157062 RepID=UPI0033FC8F05